ncbi:MAG TPA: glutathione synthase [Alphaproteobacteria bacterium]|nr:MAG: glutathione synthase [Rhodospirillales bacterium]HOO81997.1 glutathione synthase [Alphaproteobacteria bacterium]
MSLKVALQMDHPASLNYKKDSSFLIGLEAQKRGHKLFYYSPLELSLKNGKLSAPCAPLQFRRKKDAYFTLGAFEETDLTTFDIILMRQDFNNPSLYNTITHILDHISDQTLILNDPTGVRESPEKLLITHFPELAPPTLITRNLDKIREFQKKHPNLILKPLNGFGGMDVYHIKPNDPNLQAVFEMFCRLHPEPFVVQKYLPEIRKGDKRLIVVEGEPIAALLRVPQENNARANLAAGGSAAIGKITPRDREICNMLKPELVRRGLVFVGLDVIGNYVTEINPKSPTGLQQIYKLQGIKCEEAIWNAYEARYIQRQKTSRT